MAFVAVSRYVKVIKIHQDQSYDHKCTATFFMKHSIFILLTLTFGIFEKLVRHCGWGMGRVILSSSEYGSTAGFRAGPWPKTDLEPSRIEIWRPVLAFFGELTNNY